MPEHLLTANTTKDIEQMKHFLSYFNQAVHSNWDAPALCDFHGDSFTFGEVAAEIERLHLIFNNAGVVNGDKIAIYGKNSARWGIAFFAVASADAVVVPILNDFTVDSAANLTAHSESKVIFTEAQSWSSMAEAGIESLVCAIDIETLQPLWCASDIATKMVELEAQIAAKFPNGVTPQQVDYSKEELDRLLMIDYTSGTTSVPKGVMLTVRNFSSNIDFGIRRLPAYSGDHMLSMLPLAHLYGMAFELTYPLCQGCAIYFLGKTPTPTILLQAFAEVQPYLIITVPLVMEKIFKSKVIPVINKPAMKAALMIPGLRQIICGQIRKKLIAALGGKVRSIIVGGASLAKNVEKAMRMIKFPYTVGYGMTECAPLIGYEDWEHFVKRSCGKPVAGMSVRVDSENPREIVGEIQVKGDNVTIGYFKNTEATAAAFTDDGWFCTGDLGVIDRHGNIFLRGRSKAMILSASGQNIYPEEIEDLLGELPMVAESLIVERDKGRLVALVVADTAGKPMTEQLKAEFEQQMNENLVALNEQLPNYSKVAAWERMEHEFEKTPKRSIKRFLYN